ncbi:hypothetical protein [Staphylococcus aureus]|uniref:SunI/YnzG family protein n=1 Tax=Staphylococcus aureus TaxID=1280 RepID=UPI000F08142C|nr:hypothetical protein [Staphylococcus aureus]RNB37822.1 hypothetical protein EDM29_15550 [Staphylococcus aureus]
MAMTVKKDNNEVRIQWRVADIKIPTNEIKNISQDQDLHAVPDLESKNISRIGSTFGKTNRVIIDTDDHEYIIYTHNDQKVYNYNLHKGCVL